MQPSGNATCWLHIPERLHKGNLGYCIHIVSSLFRAPQGNVYQHLQRVGYDAVCTSIVVAAELRFGAKKRSVPVLTAWVEQILSSIDIVPLNLPTGQTYAEVRGYLERIGQPIRPNDLLIASHAHSLGLIAVTNNIRLLLYRQPLTNHL